eukprot:9822134-Ditylum_brightwellii.AAC.1
MTDEQPSPLSDKDSLTTNRHLLLVLTGKAGQLPAYTRLVKELGFWLTMVKAWVGKLMSHLVDKWILEDSLLHSNFNLAPFSLPYQYQQTKYDGILAYDEYWVELASQLGEMLGHACDFLKTYSLPYVHFAKIHSAADIDLIQLKFPLVFKPVSGAGSQFVQRVDTPAELSKTFCNAIHGVQSDPQAYPWAVTVPDKELFILEEMVLDAEEVNIDLLVQDGQIVFWSVSDSFQTACLPYFFETGGKCPSCLPDAAQCALYNLASSLIATMQKELENTNGCFHLEALVSNSGPVPIEVNCHLGGDC